MPGVALTLNPNPTLHPNPNPNSDPVTLTVTLTLTLTAINSKPGVTRTCTDRLTMPSCRAGAHRVAAANPHPSFAPCSTNHTPFTSHAPICTLRYIRPTYAPHTCHMNSTNAYPNTAPKDTFRSLSQRNGERVVSWITLMYNRSPNSVVLEPQPKPQPRT